MREIKFRAFIEISGKLEVVYSDPLFPHLFWQNVWKATYDTSPDCFMGIQDINGIEIWEGDIVQYRTEYDKTKHFSVIEVNDIATGCPLFHYDDYSNGNLDWGTLKVVGNRHENPELLKKC